MVANYADIRKVANYMMGYGRWPTANTDMEGGQLYGYGIWPTIGIWKVANYGDNDGGQLNGYGRGQLTGYGRWPTIRIW